ncbi:MAG: hypothetical protein CMJ32_10925 [Phycisphaerae bacterium]|nr:hypothetical protein [Phycisphaerae bacterium]
MADLTVNYAAQDVPPQWSKTADGWKLDGFKIYRGSYDIAFMTTPDGKKHIASGVHAVDTLKAVAESTSPEKGFWLVRLILFIVGRRGKSGIIRDGNVYYHEGRKG